MTKLETIWVEGVATVHYVVDAHTTAYVKLEIVDKLVAMFPTSNIIVSFADGTMSTNIAKKPE